MRIGKTHRMIAAALVLILTLFTFVGCTSSELGYMKLLQQESMLRSYTIDCNMNLEINWDGLYPYYSEEDSAEMLKAVVKMTGAVSVESGVPYIDLAIQYGINQTKLDKQFHMTMVDNTLSVPVKDAIDAMITNYEIDGMSADLCAKMKSELEKQLAGYDMVSSEYSEVDELGVGYTPDVLYDMMNADSIQQEYDLMEKMVDQIFNGVKQMFAGFDSKLFKQSGSGYTLEVTPDNALVFTDSLIKYLKTNKKTIYKGMVSLSESLAKLSEEMTAESVKSEELMDNIFGDEQNFYDGIDEMAAGYETTSDYDKDMMKLMFKGSYLKHAISKSGNTFINDTDMSFSYQGNKIMSAKGQSKMTAASALSPKTVKAANPISFEEIAAIMESVDRKVNHATEIGLSWYNDEAKDQWASMDVTKVSGYDYDTFPFRNIDNRLYLPMRSICEWFGEEVQWDNAMKKAYVVRGSERIEMTGLLDQKTLFVKVRDFEKLGYTVDYEYEEEYGEHYVTIVK